MVTQDHRRPSGHNEGGEIRLFIFYDYPQKLLTSKISETDKDFNGKLNDLKQIEEKIYDEYLKSKYMKVEEERQRKVEF